LCGGPNGCVPAATGRFDVPCWCASATFSERLLARVPVGQRGLSGIASMARARCATWRLAWTKLPTAIRAAEAPPRAKQTNYPEPFASRMQGREKRPLGDLFGLRNFGVNLTRLAPGGQSSLRHAHTRQDEFVYILEGSPTLHTDEGSVRLAPGMCAGFNAGTGNGHHLVNETAADVVYLEVGDRLPGDEASYPDDDLRAALADGKWRFVHKDGTPYA
jgi:uncharacterized cupin superfamily protein